MTSAEHSGHQSWRIKQVPLDHTMLELELPDHVLPASKAELTSDACICS